MAPNWKTAPTHDHDDINRCTACLDADAQRRLIAERDLMERFTDDFTRQLVEDSAAFAPPTPPAEEKRSYKDVIYDAIAKADNFRYLAQSTPSPAKEEPPMNAATAPEAAPSALKIEDSPDDQKIVVTDAEGNRHSFRAVLLWKGVIQGTGAYGIDDVFSFIGLARERGGKYISADGLELSSPDAETIAKLEFRLKNQSESIGWYQRKEARDAAYILELQQKAYRLESENRRLTDDVVALTDELAETIEVTSKTVTVSIDHPEGGGKPFVASTIVDTTVNDEGDPINVALEFGGLKVTATYTEERE